MAEDRPRAGTGNDATSTVPLAKGTVYVPEIDTHLIRSKHVRQTFKISVMQPVRSYEEGVRVPVVFATDGNLSFDMLKGISYLIQEPGGRVPRFILVGIGYPGGSPHAGAFLRGRDLIFPGYPRLSRQPPTEHGVLLAEDDSAEHYGAENFRNFIEYELVPFIDATYDTLPGDRTYFGHSAGGGFGLFTWFTRPNLFQNHIVSSPGVIYHGTSSANVLYEDYAFLLQDTRNFIASGSSVQGTRLYLSVGAEEEFEPALAQWRLTSSFYRLVALLRSARIPGLQLITEVFAGETHATAWPVAYMHGLRAVLLGNPDIQKSY